MKFKNLMISAVVVTAGFSLAQASANDVCAMSDDDAIAHLTQYNENLELAGHDIRVAEVQCFMFGNGRPAIRVLQQPFRWVAFDGRRLAQGDDITYMIDDANNAGSTSVGSFPTAAVRAGQAEWFDLQSMRNVDGVERASIAGLDVTIYDGELGGFCPAADLPGNGLANFIAADIIHAGWYPASCFGANTLAFSVTFTWSSELNGDNYADTALNEVYYNDAWGTVNGGNPWATGGAALPAIDVRTVAFHESGHSLGVGHFGPPPDAVMNPIYAGPRHDPFAIDAAGMSIIWNRWPN